MAFKTCVKQLLRNPIKTLLYFLLLALSCLLLCVSVGMLVSALASAAEVDAVFTTIAVPNVSRASDVSAEKVIELAKKSPYVRQVELRRRLRGVNPDISPYRVPSEYHDDVINYAMNLLVMEVICESTYETKTHDSVMNAEILKYSAVLNINRVLSINPDVDVPAQQVELFREIFYGVESNGKNPFTPGNKYIIWAELQDFVITDSGIPRIDLWKIYPTNKNGNRVAEKLHDGVKYVWTEIIEGAGFLPIAEIQGSAEGFLNSEDGAIWRDIIEANTHSIEVLTTNSLESLLFFNEGKANIAQGRGFTKAEYDRGEKVCVIGAQFAQQNGIKVGDKLDLKLNFTYEKQQNIGGNEYFWITDAFDPANGYAQENEYEVIGIYTSPEGSVGPFYISPNMVFVPDKSISSSQGYPIKEKWTSEDMRQYTPLTYAVVLHNGGLEGFKAELSEQGLEDAMLYFDQGYSRIGGTISAFKENAWTLFAVSAAAWAAVAMLFVYFYIIRQKKETGVMLSLGTGKAQSFRYILSCVIVISLAASIAGSVVGYSLYEKAVNTSYELALEGADENPQYSGGGSQGSANAEITVIKQPQTVFMAAGVQFILLASASSFAAVFMVKRKPLRLIQDR